MDAQQTIYCGKPHRRSDGLPVEHACRVLFPAFLEAERRLEYERAVEVLEAMPIVLHGGVGAGDGPPVRGRDAAPRAGAAPAAPRNRHAAAATSPPVAALMEGGGPDR